jgi:hypothetical protein
MFSREFGDGLSNLLIGHSSSTRRWPRDSTVVIRRIVVIDYTANVRQLYSMWVTALCADRQSMMRRTQHLLSLGSAPISAAA